MSSVRFSASSFVTAATQITVGLGGTPNVGDLVLVWLAMSNQIVVHPPGWNVVPPGGGPNQLAWFKAGGISKVGTNHSVFNLFYHTWNASDSGSSAIFTFSPAPSLGIGDMDLSNANALALAIVVAATPGAVDFGFQSSREGSAMSIAMPPVKRAASSSFTGVFNTAGQSWTANDGTLVLSSSHNGQAVAVFQNTSPVVAGYSDTFSITTFNDVLLAYVTLSDNGPNIYNPPVIYEAPAADSPLFYRYTHQRYYTVLNNLGVFTAIRFPTTDTLAAATRVFSGNAPITPTDLTNLLNAGVGGDFRYSPTGS